MLVFDLDFYFWKEGKILSHNPETQQVDIEILSSLPGEFSRKEFENLGSSYLLCFLHSFYTQGLLPALASVAISTNPLHPPPAQSKPLGPMLLLVEVCGC